MFKKIKSALSKPINKVRAAYIGATAAAMSTFMPFVSATGGAFDQADTTVKNLITVILKIFFYIGMLLLVWSVGMLVLAFKNEDADSKSRAMMMLVVSIVLMGLEAFLKLVLPAGYI